MRFSKAALLCAASLAGVLESVNAAQQMPSCAGTCLQSSLDAQDVCTATDLACLCTNVPLNAAIQTCVLQSCTIIEALAAQNVSHTMCGAEVRDITNITPIISGTFGGAALITVIIRVWMSWANFWLDDATCVAAMLFALPMAVLEFIMSHLGFGKDIWTIPPGDIYRIVQYTWLTEIFWFASLACVKLSFLFFYLRVFPGKRLRKVIYVLIAIALLDLVIFPIVTIVNCLPISYIWTNWDGQHTGTCVNFNAFAWAHAAFDIAFDCAIFGVPIPELLKLQMSFRKRIMLVAMFGVGAFGTIVSIVRLQALVAFSRSTNPTWDNCPTAYWSVLSCFVGILCACMPAMRRLLAVNFKHWFGSSSSPPSSGYRGYSDMPSGRVSKAKGSNGQKGSRLTVSRGGGLGSITKTVDTIVASNVEDDEFRLVEFEGRYRGAMASARGLRGSSI